MPALLVGDRVLVTIIGSVHGQRTMNTFPYIASAVPPDQDQDAAFTALNASINAVGGVAGRLRACAPGNWTHMETWYQVIKPVRNRKFVASVAVPGTFDDTAYTGNVQASITRVGAQARRKDVGGVRICIGTTSNSTVLGLVTPELKLALTGLANAMKLNIITAGVVATYLPLVGLPKNNGDAQLLYDAFPQGTTRVLRRRTVGLGI